MRIAFICHHFSEYSFSLALALSESNHKVLLILREENALKELGPKILNNKYDNLRIVTVPYYSLSMKKPTWIYSAFRLALLAYIFRADVIHTHDHSIKDFSLAMKLIRKPLVVTIHDHIPHTGKDSIIAEADRKRSHQLWRNADATIVHGKKIRSELVSEKPWTKNKTFVINHGVLGQGQVEMIPQTSNVFLFFGRIEEYKGLSVLLDACDILNREGVEFEVIVAGRGSDLENHKERIKSIPQVTLEESYIPAQEIPMYFNKAKAVLMPYLDATQSGVACLAFNFGCPVIATDVGSLSETIIHDYNGLIVGRADPVALAHQIKQLINNHELSKRLSNNALAFAKKELSWNHISDQTLRAYKFAQEQHSYGRYKS